jgi:hypothetical protein
MKTGQVLLPLKFRYRVHCSAARVDDENHHLRRKPSGYWQLRITVDRGRKFVGQRVILGLRTRCEKEARQRRDVILAVLEKARIGGGVREDGSSYLLGDNFPRLWVCCNWGH